MEETHLSGKIRVLVGSSDAQVRKLLCSSLTRDHRFDLVAEAADGGAVVACNTGFDAAVVDVGISGLGILGVMSSLSRKSPRSAVVVVSPTDAVYLRHACLAEGAADYLVLPGDLPQLRDRVVRALQAAKVTVPSE